MSYKSALQECSRRVPHKSVPGPQERPTRVSYKSVTERDCPTRVTCYKTVSRASYKSAPHKSDKQECPHKNVLQECQSVPQECPTRVSKKSCPARVSYKRFRGASWKPPWKQKRPEGELGWYHDAGTSSGVPGDILGSCEELRWVVTHTQTPSIALDLIAAPAHGHTCLAA